MAEISPPYRRIYFDSNILIKANWPRLSQAMRTALEMSKLFSIPTVLLHCVEWELRAHCLRNWVQTRNETAAGVDALVSLCKPFGIDVSGSLPSDDQLDYVYEQMVDEIVNNFDILRSAPKLRLTEELFEMAIHKRKPFGDKGKNFQDAVICLAAIDDLVSSSEPVGALVSRDDVFDQKIVDDLSGSQGATISVFKSEVALSDDLRTFLRQQAAREWSEDEERAKAAITENLPKLQEFININLEVPVRLGFTNRILSVNRIEIVEVTRVQTPTPWDRTPGEPVTITAKILVNMHATVRRPSASAYPVEVLKVGQSTKPPALVLRVPREGERDEVLRRTLAVEVRASVEDGRYVNMEPLSVAVTTDTPMSRIGALGLPSQVRPTS